MSQRIIQLTTGAPPDQVSLSTKEQVVGQNVMRNNLRLKPSENVLVVTDTGEVKTVAHLLWHAAAQITNRITYIQMEPAGENAQEPPAEVTRAMKEAGVAFLVTTYSLSHTKARLEATRSGARIASMPGITLEMTLRTLAIDNSETARLSKLVSAVLTRGNKAILKSDNGTDAIFDLTGRAGMTDTGFIHNPGDFDNLPAGEGFIAPVEGKTQGVIVFDGCFADIVLDQPIKVLIENGVAVDILGGEAARLLNERLARVGKRGYNIAELGIGTNKMAFLGNNLLEVEKVYGTVHVALGNNATIGGEVDVPFHSDGVILSPTLTVDDVLILKGGKFQID